MRDKQPRQAPLLGGAAAGPRGGGLVLLRGGGSQRVRVLALVRGPRAREHRRHRPKRRSRRGHRNLPNALYLIGRCFFEFCSFQTMERIGHVLVVLTSMRQSGEGLRTRAAILIGASSVLHLASLRPAVRRWWTVLCRTRPSRGGQPRQWCARESCRQIQVRTQTCLKR